MKIQQENLDKLNAVLNIDLVPEDYMAKYEKALKDYGKKVTLPGFRVGMVPAAVVKKRFGKSLLADEINKLINASISNHIQENKLEVLGNPLPRHNQSDGGDWDNPANFTFSYDLGLAPQFDIKLSTKDKQSLHVIKVDDTMINKQIGDISRRYGKLSTPETSGDNDLLIVDLAELDASGEVQEGGITATTTVSLEFVKDKATKTSLLAKKIGDVVNVDVKKLVEDEHDLVRMLKLSNEQVKDLSSTFRLSVNEVRTLTPAALDQDLFDKVFGVGGVTNESEFRGKIAEQLKNNFVNDSNRLFKRDVTNTLLDKVALQLPDEFLKKWIMASNDRPLSHEQLESDYPNYAKGLKWQLIENKLFQEGGLKIENEDLMAEAKAIMADQFARYGVPIDSEELLVQSAQRLLGNRDEMKYVYEQVAEKKLMSFIKENISIKEVEVSFDDFVKLASENKD